MRTLHSKAPCSSGRRGHAVQHHASDFSCIIDLLDYSAFKQGGYAPKPGFFSHQPEVGHLMECLACIQLKDRSLL